MSMVDGRVLRVCSGAKVRFGSVGGRGGSGGIRLGRGDRLDDGDDLNHLVVVGGRFAAWWLRLAGSEPRAASGRILAWA